MSPSDDGASSGDDETERRPLLQTAGADSGTGESSSNDVVLLLGPATLEAPQPQSKPSASRSLDASQSRRRAASAAASRDSTAAAEEPRTCRICFETEDGPHDGDPNNPLISPCMCSGSSRFVHRQCLASWRNAAHRADAFYECEVCKFRYRYSRAWWASLLGSRVTQVSVFVALLSLLVAGLGLIPIVATAKPDSPSPVALHVLNGVAMLGLLGLLASIALGILSAIGAVPLSLPEVWFPAALCLDCQGGGIPLCLELSAGGAECGALLGIALIAVGVAASAVLIWQLLLVATRRALDKAQHMVENVQQGADSTTTTA